MATIFHRKEVRGLADRLDACCSRPEIVAAPANAFCFSRFASTRFPGWPLEVE